MAVEHELIRAFLYRHPEAGAVLRGYAYGRISHDESLEAVAGHLSSEPDPGPICRALRNAQVEAALDVLDLVDPELGWAAKLLDEAGSLVCAVETNDAVAVIGAGLLLGGTILLGHWLSRGAA
jgi:hypothetical protein